MLHEIYFDDVAGSTLGVWLTGLPAIPAARGRGTRASVPGRDGDLFQSDGALDPVKLQLELFAEPDAQGTVDFDRIHDWIYNATRLRISPYNWFWRIHPEDVTISWNEWADMPMDAMESGKITIMADPHRYLYPETAPITLAGGTILHNPTRCTAAPIIAIDMDGSGEVHLMIGRSSLLIAPYNGTILLDCEARTAENPDGTESLTGLIHMTDMDDTGPARRWPMLRPGDNAIDWSGNATVTITPRWRER